LQPFVFISYSHADSTFAAKFAERLRSSKIAHFRDVEFIDWGEDIPDRVHDALEKATHLVVLISPGSEDSQWVAYEMGYAKGRKVTVVPYLLHPKMKLPGFISSLRYLQSPDDERKFITSLRASQLRGSTPLVQRTSPPAANEPTLESRLSSPNGSVRRQAAIEIGESGERRFVSILCHLLEKEENENVRESVIKSLGKLGGEEAAATLESVWFGKEKSRFGKAAARNALKEMNFWQDNAPFLDPSVLGDIFISLQTHRTERDSKRERGRQELLDEVRGQLRANLLSAGYTLNEIVDLGTSLKSESFVLAWKVSKLQQQWYHRIHYSIEVKNIDIVNTMIRWSPTVSDEILVTTRDTLSIESAAEHARKAELNIDLILDNRIRVVGNQWPGGITSKFGALSLDLSKTIGGTTAIMNHIPYGVCNDWLGCIRLIVRLIRWLGACAYKP
jgi:hypothetical protein